MADRAGWREAATRRRRPGLPPELAEQIVTARKRRAARARTFQLVEWLGMAAIMIGVLLLAGPAWGLVAAARLIVVANAS